MRNDTFRSPHLARARAVLRLPEFFNAEELARAFRRAALRAHPDKGGTPRAIREVYAANDLLKAYLRRPRREARPRYPAWAERAHYGFPGPYDRRPPPPPEPPQESWREKIEADEAAWKRIPWPIRVTLCAAWTVWILALVFMSPLLYLGPLIIVIALLFGELRPGAAPPYLEWTLLTYVLFAGLCFNAFDRVKAFLQDRYAEREPPAG